MSDIIDINVYETTEEVTINVTPNVIEVNINKITGGGGGATNLGYTASPTNGIVTSDTGTDATIPLATSTNAGLLSPTEKTKIANSVPYTGATENVDLGEFELKSGQLTLDTTPTGTASVGTTKWNDTIGSSETTLKGGNVVLKNGVDLVARIVNKVTPNTTLTKASYQVVKVSGAQGQRLAVDLAQANNDNNSADTLGIVTETIATNQEGFIITVGQLEGINTTGSLQGETWADGDVLYLSPTTAGKITNIKPTGETGHIVILGYVEYAHANNGKIYVKIMNGWELDELHNVSITSVADKQLLSYDSATSLWKNKSVTTTDIPDSTNKRYQTDNQNSFNDATSSIQTQLNNKQPSLSFTPFKFIQTSQTAHTGTTAETIVATSTINGGTFNSSDVMKAIFKCTKGVTTSTVTIRLKINTTNSLSGATQIAILSVTTALQFAKLKRDYDLFGGTLYGFNFTSSVSSDDITSGTIGQSTAYNTANTLYFFFTVQLGTSGDSVIPNLANLTN